VYLKSEKPIWQCSTLTLFAFLLDEPNRALRRLAVTSNIGEPLEFHEFDQPAATGFIQRALLAPLDDLEAIARVSEQQFFIIGSHEHANTREHPARRKLVLLTRDGEDMVSAAMRRDLYTHLRSRYPELRDKIEKGRRKSRNIVNIEGLAYDRKRQRLLVGLRNPLLDDATVVVSILNAIDYATGAEPEFADALHLLDLDKDGIRAMAYDDASDTLLLIGKREHGGSNRSTLWQVPADSLNTATRFRSDDKKLFDDVEGLTPLRDKILFVRDNGGSQKEDNWFTLHRSQLELDTQ